MDVGSDPQQPPADDDGNLSVSIRQYVEILLRWKWLVAAVVAVTVGATAIWTFTRVRIYRSSTSVLVNKTPPEVLGTKVREVVDLSRESYQDTKEYLENQRAIACSSSVAQHAAQRLNLGHNRRFWNVLPGAPFRPTTAKQAAARLIGMTRCTPRRDTTIMDIAVEHPDPRMAATLADGMAAAYIEQNLERKVSSTFGATKWLSKRLDDLRGQLEQSEKKLFKFKKDNKLLAVPLAGQQNLLSRQISRLNEELASTRVRRMALSSELEQLQKVDASDPLAIPAGPLVDSPLMQQLKMTYVAERRKYLALSQRYLERHPQVVQQRIRMQSAGKDILREVKNRVAGLKALLRKAHKEETQLSGAIASVKRQALDLSQKEQAFRQLQRPVNTTNKLYDLLLARLKESNISGQLNINNMHVLEPAWIPGAPVRPRTTVNLAVGVMLGLLLGIGLAFLLEALDSTVKAAEDIERLTPAICLGAIPSVGNNLRGSDKLEHPLLARSPALVVHHRPLSPPAEAWRVVRTNLMFSSPDKELKTLVVTSAGPEEGKTTVAAGLATAIAQSGKSVLLVDADMRQPRLHKVMDVPGGEGLSSALRGEEQVESLVKTTEVPNLFVLPCGPIPPNPAELCQSDRMASVIKQLGMRFDRIIIDSPPVMLVTDATLLSARFDGTMMVVRTGKTGKNAFQEAFRQIHDVGANVVGCVLNDRDLNGRRYRYYPYRGRAYRMHYGYQGQPEDRVG